MRTIRILLFATAVSGVLQPHAARAQCTPESADNRRLVEEFATGTGAGAGKARPAGVPVVPSDQVRLLTNAGDAAACQQLFSRYMGLRRNPETAPVDRHWTFYQVGELYYIIVGWSTPPVWEAEGVLYMRHAWIPIIILDQQFQVLGVVSL